MLRLHLVAALALLSAVPSLATLVTTPNDAPQGEMFIAPGRHVFTSSAASLPQENAAPGGCSIGFILKVEGTEPAVYYATGAAHCGNVVGERVKHTVWGEWGTVIWRNLEYDFYGEVVSDINVIQIDAPFQDNVDPAIPHLGGPTGIAQPGSLDDTAPIAHCGFPGALLAMPTCLPRVGILVQQLSTEWRCRCVATHGDSGSPVIDLATGHAMGLEHSGTPTPTPPNPWVPDPALHEHRGAWYANEMARIEAVYPQLELATAPLSPLAQDLGR